jgi:glycosyltransferase involved in cell wall biosynthesis
MPPVGGRLIVGLSSVSVVIPAFNAAEFIEDTVKSVLSQSQGDVEILVVDDGSTDETPGIVRSFGSAIRYLRQENAGVSAARNHGLQESTGTFICFLDADDWLYPEDLERKIEVLKSNPKLALVHSWVEVTDRNLKPTGTVMKGAKGNILGDLLRLIPPAVPGPSSGLMRRAVVEELGGFDEELGTSADFDLWLRIAMVHPVGRVDQVSVKYRRHEGAMFGNLEAQLRDMERVFRKHRSRLQGEPDWKTLQWRFYRSIAGEYAHRGSRLKAVRYVLKGLQTGWRNR